MPANPNPLISWAPPELVAAAGPLESVRHLLRAVSDDHGGIAVLADGSPTPAVKEALQAYLTAYANVLFELASKAGSLATNLRGASETYIAVEQHLAAR